MTKETFEKSDKSDDGEREKIPFSLPNSDQILSYLHYRLNKKHPPDTHHARHTYVDPEEEALKALLKRRGVEPNIFTALRGSGGAASFSHSRYILEMRTLTKWRLLVGQKRDAIILLDQQLHNEHSKFVQAMQDYKECVKALEKFLEVDHEESMRVLSQADAELSRTNELSTTRDELSRKYGQVRLAVYHWEEEWRTVRACHRFLYRVAPLTGAVKASDLEETVEEGDSSTDSGTNVQAAATTTKRETHVEFGEFNSLNALIFAFEQEVAGLPKSPSKLPEDIGFTEANDLLKIFRSLEVQNLNALIHLESLGGPMSEMISKIDHAESRVKGDIEDVLEHINHVEQAIEREERRAVRLEKRSVVLIQKCFRQLICSPEALQTKVLIEDAYESCIGPNEAGLDALAMACSIESTYARLSGELDMLPKHLVVICEREGFRQELREAREAEDAATKFELMHRLLSAVKRIMEPTQPKYRMLMRRSKPMTKLVREQKKAEGSMSPSDLDAQNVNLFGKTCQTNTTETPDYYLSDEED